MLGFSKFNGYGICLVNLGIYIGKSTRLNKKKYGVEFLLVQECGDDIGVLHNKGAILLCNHQSTGDTPVIMVSTYNKKMASGTMLWIIYVIFKYTHFGVVSCLRGDFFIDQVIILFLPNIHMPLVFNIPVLNKNIC